MTDIRTAPAGEPHTVTAVELTTSGGPQLVVGCPRCSGWHRHIGLGLRRSPCGLSYLVTTQHDPAPAAA